MQLQEASLKWAQLQAARLDGARMDADTNLKGTNFQGASLRAMDLTSVSISPEQIAKCFGDASVTLPGGVTPDHPDWPPHWPKDELEWGAFNTQWRAFQQSIGYTPPENPA